MFCKNCGKEIPEHSAVCPLCGGRQTITELEYRTGSRTLTGALLRRYREEPVTRQGAILLEILGILLGFGGVIFAIVCPDMTLSVGQRAMLILCGGGLALGFGIALCVTLSHCRKPEVP